ncbi:hypothetical protein [Kineococcus sp. SYSU DK003]|uniref:hypothetical protein n=1 Tax=Kineococcus sp. SYSU DK003 TaxID=3383124 RepID=UPI003D7DE7F8
MKDVRCLIGRHHWIVQQAEEDRHPYRTCVRCHEDEAAVPGDYPAALAHVGDFFDRTVSGFGPRSR